MPSEKCPWLTVLACLRSWRLWRAGALKGHASNETRILERTLKQIGDLLNVGFGQAGSTIIANRIKQGGKVDTTAEGKRVTGAFGFCDIRQVAEATECLQVRFCVPVPCRATRVSSAR